MTDGQIDIAAEVAATEYIRGTSKTEIAEAVRARLMYGITHEEATMMVEAIDAYEDQREAS